MLMCVKTFVHILIILHLHTISELQHMKNKEINQRQNGAIFLHHCSLFMLCKWLSPGFDDREK